MNDETTREIQQLRQDVLSELVDLSAFLVDDETTSYSVLLALARSTHNPRLLEQAHKKILAIEDQKEKSDALLDLLDEIEISLSTQETEASDQPVTNEPPNDEQPN